MCINACVGNSASFFKLAMYMIFGTIYNTYNFTIIEPSKTSLDATNTCDIYYINFHFIDEVFLLKYNCVTQRVFMLSIGSRVLLKY